MVQVVIWLPIVRVRRYANPQLHQKLHESPLLRCMSLMQLVFKTMHEVHAYLAHQGITST